MRYQVIEKYEEIYVHVVEADNESEAVKAIFDLQGERQPRRRTVIVEEASKRSES